MFLSVAIVLVMLVSVPAIVFAINTGNLFGDVTGDGVINAADSTMLRRYLAAADKEDFIANNNFILENANVIGNGRINHAAVDRLRQHIGATNPETVSLGPRSAPILSPMLADRITNDYIRLRGLNPNMNIRISHYYGRFGESEVVIMGSPTFNFGSQVVTVAGYEFYFTLSQPILVYRNSNFLLLGAAYEAGWLTASGIGAIWEKHSAFALTPELAGSIKDAIVQNHRPGSLMLTMHYGTFSGNEAVFVEMFPTPDALNNFTIAGYRFRFSNLSHTIHIYRDSQILTIEDAFAAGWITVEDVSTIWWRSMMRYPIFQG